MLNVAVQMDHVSRVDIAGETTFTLMLEAQRRGHALRHYEVDALSMRGGRVTALAEPVKVADERGRHFELGEAAPLDLAEGADVVLMRQDPPFDMGYITATHMLERVHPDTLVVNDPAEVRNAPEKLFVMDFPDLMPDTLVTRSIDGVRAFRREHGSIILKPLYGNGGAGVFLLGPEDQNLSSLMEMFLAQSTEPVIAQAYLPAVRAGDKRIILIEGEPVGIINRVPQEGESRSNMHVGGRAEAIGMSEADARICAAIGPELRRRGFILVGIDVIGDRLTEINVTSPTGVREVKRFGGPDIAALFWDAVEARVSNGGRRREHGGTPVALSPTAP